MSKKIIIDTDPGIDDAMAILFALNSPEVEVVGLTTIFGNVPTELATQNALRLVEFAGHPQIPVAHGATVPLKIAPNPPADFVHGKDGFGEVHLPPAQGAPNKLSAAQFIVDRVMSNPGKITLVPVGPLTNLALALDLEPRIVDNVAEVVLMGGAATVNGNVDPVAEANIWNDPHAADRLFTAGWPLTMVGLDVTHETIMDDAYLQSLRGNKTGNFLYAISRFYMAFHHQVTGIYSAYTHDPSAIAYVIDPTLFTSQRGPIRVITEGMALGLTLWDRRGDWIGPNPWSTTPPVNVCIGVDSARLLSLFHERIVGAV